MIDKFKDFLKKIDDFKPIEMTGKWLSKKDKEWKEEHGMSPVPYFVPSEDERLYPAGSKAREIASICRKINITDYSIDPSDYSVSCEVFWCSDLDRLSYETFPIKFGRIQKSFGVFKSELTSLKNGPDWVGGNFLVSKTKCKNLMGGPSQIGAALVLKSMPLLETLNGTIKKCQGVHLHKLDKLSSLEGCPQTDELTIYKCNKVSSLDGAPSSVKTLWLLDNENLYTTGSWVPDMMEQVWCHTNVSKWIPMEYWDTKDVIMSDKTLSFHRFVDGKRESTPGLFKSETYTTPLFNVMKYFFDGSVSGNRFKKFCELHRKYQFIEERTIIWPRFHQACKEWGIAFPPTKIEKYYISQESLRLPQRTDTSTSLVTTKPTGSRFRKL